jgi:hypothetical protein
MDSVGIFVMRSADAKEAATPSVGGKTGGNVDETQDGGIDLEDETDPEGAYHGTFPSASICRRVSIIYEGIDCVSSEK